ncbi:hypothetical protein [Haloprofundus halophilus]|uniref:hypothetical protein n=1 Tax=Haloprofundus halophilus TaxID=2283527 RepID=UPI0013009740|nr:hypothetical protein [Haloprofundus halophilus]
MNDSSLRALLSSTPRADTRRTDRAEVPLNVAPLLLFGLILVVLTVIAEVSL